MTIRDTPSPSRIVCAALRFPSGLIVVGPRHGDATMRAQMIAAGIDRYHNAGQGFIDQHGKFFARQEAWKIAEVNGQILHRVGGDESQGGTLYSENLY